MQYINRTVRVSAHAFTSTSSGYAVENTETVKVQSVQSTKYKVMYIGDKI